MGHEQRFPGKEKLCFIYFACSGITSDPCKSALLITNDEHLMKEPQVGSLVDRTMASEGPFRHGPAVEAYNFGQFKTA